MVRLSLALCATLLVVPCLAAKERPAGSFELSSADPQTVEAWNLALRVVESNIKPWRRGLLEAETPALMAGGGYNSPWTRDASYNTYFGAGLIWPDAAKSTLLSVLERADGEVRITGQYWDSMSWATGAWALYTFTGDREFLRVAYAAVTATLAHLERTELDPETGLFFGPGWSDGIAGYPKPYDQAGGSSFILDYAKHNEGVDKIRMRALSTNALYANAYRVAARMATELGRPEAEQKSLAERGDAVARAIDEHLWISDRGHYGYFLDADGRLETSQEALGHAHVILFGVADEERARRVFEAQHVSSYGVPCNWPLFPRFQKVVGRHCGAVWPQIQGFWALAGASRGRLDVLDRELRALTGTALRSGDFREIYHPETGEPFGGLQVGKMWRSEPRQTWAATAYIAMLVRGVIGMQFEPDGVRFRPLVPSRLSPLELRGVRYRGTELDVSLTGSGKRVGAITLDGQPLDGQSPDGAWLDASLTGKHRIEIRMEAEAPLFAMQDLYKSVRIPNITVATDGTVLAFAGSGRQLRRSEDEGKTWSSQQEVGSDAGGSAIVDDTTGDVMVVRAKGGYLWRSRDHGKTWQREEIVIKPNDLGHGSLDGVPAQTACSESGLTLKYGKRRGRLLMPARVQPPHGDNAQEWWPFNYNTAIYSDDGGKTWQTSYPVQSGTGEGTLTELSSGSIYYNSRSHMSVDHRRRIAWSHDGGHMFVDWQVADDLFEVGEPFYFKYGTKPSYGCNAGLVRMPLEATDGKDVLLFSTPDDPGGHRFRMTVWASFDGGKSWPLKRLVYEGRSAYSSLAAGKDGRVYLLFERGEKKLYEHVAVACFNLAWLTKGKDWRSFLEEKTR